MIQTGYLELIIGCMYSGKSTELIKRVRAQKQLNKHILVINHKSNNRYNNLSVTTHDLDSEESIPLTNLTELLTLPSYQTTDLICIDEGQFFHDLENVIRHIVEIDKKHVIVSALDGNFRREPFMNVCMLIPFADTVHKLNALCLLCHDDTPASFSKRTTQDEAIVKIGGSEMYKSVCRRHFLERS